MYDAPKFLGSGDSCLVVEFSDSIEMEANFRLQNLMRALAPKNVRGIREFVPTYRSLSIHYDPIKTDREKLEAIARKTLESLGGGGGETRRVWVLPVLYGGEYGPDMSNVCAHTGYSENEVIKRHTKPEYYCYMLGFTPGFAYLGGLDETLGTPRLKIPRVLIPAGSVGIAGRQTGAYSIDSPGGWQLIGRTPLRLFDPGDSERPTLIEAGDWIKFRGVSVDEYASIKHDADAGRYQAEVRVKDVVQG
ncbi:MAG: 5-oxoprolinase subunit PxpB [Synergistaceae bacterium]|jgi:KipI family sensor histidine kinase inhibitor|nr:5-oxoprolinase subunit PxpB [Synergistaceae bacterium]